MIAVSCQKIPSPLISLCALSLSVKLCNIRLDECIVSVHALLPPYELGLYTFWGFPSRFELNISAQPLISLCARILLICGRSSFFR